MIVSSGIDQDDLETLTEILERERTSHQRKCGLCFAMFVLAFVSLLAALGLVGVNLATAIGSSYGFEALGGRFFLFQVLTSLAAVALSFFGAWWTAQNCLNSIERTLCAARNRRFKLFAAFLEQIQCAGKSKQRAWLEIIKSAIM